MDNTSDLNIIGDAAPKPTAAQILSEHAWQFRQLHRTDTQATGDAAPSSVAERLWDVTRDGVMKIPDGIVKSLNAQDILPNVATGFFVGAGLRGMMRAAGPVGRTAEVALATYFIGKPLVGTYIDAVQAKTRDDMNRASSNLGDTIGGAPVAMVEGAIGARLGSGAMGRLLRTDAAVPFLTWRNDLYDRVGQRFGPGTAGERGAGIYTLSNGEKWRWDAKQEKLVRHDLKPGEKTIAQANEEALAAFRARGLHEKGIDHLPLLRHEPRLVTLNNGNKWLYDPTKGDPGKYDRTFSVPTVGELRSLGKWPPKPPSKPSS